MRVFHGFADQLDVQTIVRQMDQITWELKSAWEKVDSKWAIMLTQGTADAAEAQIRALKNLIADLDVGGVGREHVFFPLPGQTSEEAWAAYREVAEHARQSLAQLGAFISKWSLTTALPRIAGDVRNSVVGGTTALAVAAGVLAVLVLASNTRRSFSGYRRRRR